MKGYFAFLLLLLLLTGCKGVESSQTITFNTNGGNELSEIQLNPGTYSLDKFPTPVKDGYTFDGWYKDNNLTQLFKGTIEKNTNYTLYAKWEIKTYTVTFKDYDGTVLDTQTIDYGSNATAPNDPTRTGYTFSGWDTEFSNITVDTTVTATYAINTYTVIFKNYDGTVLDTQTIDYGSNATAPSDPIRTEYTFSGWDTDFSSITADTTITATYAINTYTVIFRDYDGTVLDTQTIDYGSNATAPNDPTRTGYTFSGWDTDFSNITEDTTVTATYNINTYTITFKDENGTVLDTQTINYGDNVSVSNITKIGYSLDLFTDINLTNPYDLNSLDYSNLTLYAKWTFAPTDGIVYTLSTDSSYYTVTGYTGTDSTVAIPCTYNGKPVLEISNNAFLNNIIIRNVVFEPNSQLTTIGDNAFSGTQISSIVIPASVISIGDNAFSGNHNLSSVTFENNSHLTTIGGFAFEETNLTNITIPESVTSIGIAPFPLTMESINVDSNNNYYISEDGVLFNYDKTELLEFPGARTGSYIIPNTVKTISYGAFSKTKLSNVTITDNVQTIGQYAFYETNNLTVRFNCHELPNINNNSFGFEKNSTLYVPSSDLNQYSSIFLASNITNLTINNLYLITFNTNSSSNIDDLFVENTVITLPTPVKVGYAFKGWYLDSAFTQKFDGTVTSDITLYAKWQINTYIVTFKDYNGSVLDTQTIDYGHSATTPSDPIRTGYTFNGWQTDFSNITTDTTVTATYTINTYKVTIKDTDGSVFDTQTIDYGANVLVNNITKSGYSFELYTDSSLTNLYDLNSLVTTEITLYVKWTFEPTEELVYTLSTDSSYYTVTGYTGTDSIVAIPSTYNGKPVLEISHYAFSNNIKISEVVFENSSQLTTISDYAFMGSHIKSIIIPASVTSIGKDAFSSSSLVSITFENDSQLTTIGDHAFSNTSISSIIIPASVTSIGQGVFSTTTNLNSVTFEDNSLLTTIGNYAFSYSNITSITIPANVTSIGINAFPSTMESINVDSNNITFSSDNGVLFNDDKTVLLAFPGARTGSYIIPETVETVSVQAFFETNLSNVTIKDNVQFIDQYAFKNTDSLSVRFETNNVPTIDQYAFNKSTNLTIYVPYSNLDAYTSMLSNVTYNIKYLYIITFNTNGGNNIDSLIVEDTVTSLPVPVKNGKLFEGWYIDSACTQAFDGTLTSDITLYAKWNAYTVTFKDYNGTELDTQTIDYGSSAIAPTVPTRTGYTFDEWDTDFSNITTDTIVTATYTINTYKVTFKDNDGTVLDTETINYGDKVSVSDITKIGYSLNLFIDINLTNAYDLNSPVDNDLILYAKWTFEPTEGIVYSLSTDSSYYTVTGYTGSDSTVAIPSTYNGKPVLEIAANAFINNNIIRNVVFESNSQITNIGYDAFAGTLISSIVIPNSVISIENGAFSQDSFLTSVVFENNSHLTTIGQYAFFESPITNITIPASVTSIGAGAFPSTMESINVDSNNNHYISDDGVLFNYDKTILLDFPGAKTGTYIIPKTVETISDLAFYETSLSNVTITNNIQTIGQYAFYRADNLTVRFECHDIPNINNSFYLINNLTVYVPYLDLEAYTTILSESNITNLTINNLYFITFDTNGGNNIDGIFVEDTVNSLPTPVKNDKLFEGWYLDSACTQAFDGTLTSDITLYAKWNTYSVTFKDYDGTVLDTQTIDYGSSAIAPTEPTRTGYTFNGWDTDFSNITADTTVTVTYNIITYTVTFKDDDGTVLDTQTIDYGNSATAPSNPIKAGYAFNGWDTDFGNITSDLTVTATYNIKTYTVIFKDEDGTILDTQTIDYGSSATAPSVPTRTGYTFNGWDTDFSNITSDITVKATWTFVPTDGLIYTNSTDGTYYTVTGYTGTDSTIAIPTTYDGKPVLEISSNAFSGNAVISDVIFEEGSQLTTIGVSAFSNSSIKSITIPANVINIYHNAFEQSTLSNVNFENGSNLTMIGAHSFEGTNITSIVIPESVNDIDGYAFKNSALTNITFTSNCLLTSIGDYAFDNTQISNLVIPASVTTIGNYAFDYTPNLTTVSFEDNTQLTSIGDSAFADSILTTITIPVTVTNIGLAPFPVTMESINVDALNSTYISLDGVLFTYDETSLIQFPAARTGSYVIPNTVTYIAPFSFLMTQLNTLTITENVQYIDFVALGGVNNLTLIIETNTLLQGIDSALIQSTNLTIYVNDSVIDNYKTVLPDYSDDIFPLYTITFDTDGGNTIDNLFVESGNIITTLPIPVKNGYTFDGWYLDGAFTQSFDGTVTADITLYAKWIGN